MIEHNIYNIKILKFSNLQKHENLIHYSSTRMGGSSVDHLTSLNLGYTVKDKTSNVTNNLKLLAQSLQIDKSDFVFPKQTHSANVGIVRSSIDIFPDTDALITNIPGICISVRTADCVPILLFDPVKKAIAAIHSGWKGTVQKISQKTIELMHDEFGTNPSDLVTGIGPSIGPKVYEVGPEVVEVFNEKFIQNHFFTPVKNSNKYLLDLWEANKEILMESGIFEGKIEVAEICTYSNPELFFSARRDQGKTGRLATGIMLI